MRAVLLGLLLAVMAGLNGSAHAQELFPLQQVPIVNSACTATGISSVFDVPNPVPCPTGSGTAPPPGQHWNLVVSQDFTKYTNSNPPSWWVPNSTFPCGVSFDSNGLSLDGSASCLSADSYRASVDSPVAPYGSTFLFTPGIVEWVAKNAHYSSGLGFAPHTDLWFRTAPSSAAEDDINEAFHEVDTHYTGHTVNENQVGGEDSLEYPGTTLLDQSFNTFGFLWVPGGPCGLQTVLFNGVAQEAPYQFQNPEWCNGAKMHMSEDFSDVYNPLVVQSVRYWQLVPN